MPIIINCPTCGQQAAAPDGTTGQLVSCPHCQAVVTVPAQPDPPAAREFSRPSAHGREEEEARPSRPRRGPGCPFCGSRERPFNREEINQTGWILFVLLILFCAPLCWIPLLTCKDQMRICPECGRRRG